MKRIRNPTGIIYIYDNYKKKNVYSFDFKSLQLNERVPVYQSLRRQLMTRYDRDLYKLLSIRDQLL